MQEHKVIASINIDRSLTKLIRVTNFINSLSPIIIAIQDPPLINRSMLESLINSLNHSYKLIIAHNSNFQHINTKHIILVREQLITEVKIILFNDHSDNFTTLGISFKENHHEYNLFSIYIRPRTQHHELDKTLKIIETTAKQHSGMSNTIILGDSNSSHQNWAPIQEILTTSKLTNSNINSIKHYSQIKTNRGRQLHNWLYNNKLKSLNTITTGPTYINTKQKTSSHIDLICMGQKCIRKWNSFDVDNSLDDMGGHRIIYTQTHQRNDNHNRLNTTLHINTNKIKDELFNSLKVETNNLINNWQHLKEDKIYERMNQLTDKTYQTIKHIQQVATTNRSNTTSHKTLRNNVSRLTTKYQRQMKLVKKLIATNKLMQNKIKTQPNKSTHPGPPNDPTDTVQHSTTCQPTQLSNTIQPAQPTQSTTTPQPTQHIQTLQSNQPTTTQHSESIRRTQSLEPISTQHNATNQPSQYTRIKQQITYNRKKIKTAKNRLLIIKNKIRNQINTNTLQNNLSISKIIQHSSTNILPNTIPETIIDFNLHDNERSLHNTWEIIHYAENLLKSKKHVTTDKPSTYIEDNQNKIDINQICKDKFPQKNRNNATEATTEAQKDIYKNIPQTERLITEKEILRAIYEVRKKKYTGPEGMKFAVFNKSLNYITDIIVTIAQMSYYIGKIPRKCQITLGTMIPKKNPGQYRIVHISTPLAALLEIIALHRLEYMLEIKGLLNIRQYGFTALRGRHDLLTRALEFIIKHKILAKANAKSTLVSLDIEGAFDNVDQNIIISQLYRLLGHNITTLWIADFMLTRSIKIRINDQESKIRPVNTGVPQGSSLGPILFNFAIHNIDEGLNVPNKIELLSYADDLIILHNGQNNLTLQQTINKLTDKLATYKLKIKPEKCNLIVFNNGKPNHCYNRIYIYGKTIQRTNTINILGVPITSKLTLDTANEDLNRKILNNANKLHQLNQLNIINSKKEWRALLTSYIYSLTYIGNAPIIAIDHKARIWCDKVHAKILKFIFNWPSNASSKTTRYLTDCHRTTEATQCLIRNRHNTEHKTGYEMIISLQRQNIPQLNNKYLHRIQLDSIEDLDARFSERKYTNPTLCLNTPQHLTINEQTANEHCKTWKDKPYWLIINQKNSTTAVQLLNSIITSKQSIQHNQWPNSYFNQLAALWHIVIKTNNKGHNTTWLTDQKNSIVQALYNMNNHDWRIIKLRETMVTRGWNIHFLHDTDTQQIKDQLTIKQHQQHRKRLEKNQQNPHEHNVENEGTNHMSTNQPDIADYIRASDIKQHKKETLDMAKQTDKTDLIKELTTKAGCEIEIPPNWITGKAILALSGLTLNSANELTNSTTEPHLNTCQCLHRISIYRHPTLHKALECQQHQQNRTELLYKKLNRIENFPKTKEPNIDLRNILQNKRSTQAIIKLLSKVSLNAQSTHNSTNSNN